MLELGSNEPYVEATLASWVGSRCGDETGGSSGVVGRGLGRRTRWLRSVRQECQSRQIACAPVLPLRSSRLERMRKIPWLFGPSDAPVVDDVGGGIRGGVVG